MMIVYKYNTLMPFKRKEQQRLIEKNEVYIKQETMWKYQNERKRHE